MGHKTVLFGLLFLVGICCVGCSDDILDPTDIGLFRPTPVVNVILDNLGVVDQPEETFANAEEPLPKDAIAANEDYSFGSGDVIRINIYELYEESVPFVNDYIVTETGNISIPDVGVVKAEGLTETQLEKVIEDFLSPDILVSPSVKVSLFESQRRTFSISGKGVLRGSRYQIPRHDFRLLDAIALAGGIEQFNVSNIYITREVTGEDPLEIDLMESKSLREPEKENKDDIEQDLEGVPEEEGLFNLISPSFSENTSVRSGAVVSASEMASEKELEMLAASALADSPDKSGAAESDDSVEEIEWIFKDGKYVPVPVKTSPDEENADQQTPTAESFAKKDDSSDSYGWDDIGSGGKQSRLIRIPVDKLYGGDPQYNIVIRPGDSVTVPVDMIGEFYVMGNFNNNGPINLTGRKMTLMRAVSAAGGLGELAWPKKVEITRMIGKDKQVTVLVDLDKIAKGTQPDIFIKPDDLINVGTHGSARFLSVLRNAFRATYGVGFIYDRNFVYGNQYYDRWQ